MSNNLELKIGAILKVQKTNDIGFIDEWFESPVVGITIFHDESFTNPGHLKPWICVMLGEGPVSCFNYSLYAADGRVKFKDMPKTFAEPEEYRVIVVNMCHLTLHDGDKLSVLADHKSAAVSSTTHSYIVKTYLHKETGESLFPADLRMSPSFNKIMTYARENNFAAIEFDNHGAMYWEFDQHVW